MNIGSKNCIYLGIKKVSGPSYKISSLENKPETVKTKEPIKKLMLNKLPIGCSNRRVFIIL